MTNAIKDLINAQKQCAPLVKNAVNPHFRNKYADLGAVLEASMDAFHKNNFAVLQIMDADEHGRYVSTQLQHESGTNFESKVYLALSKQDMQGLGSAITYARRYGLLGLAGLSAEDDDGNASVPSKSAGKTFVSDETPASNGW
jgi:hypothetical protein